MFLERSHVRRPDCERLGELREAWEDVEERADDTDDEVAERAAKRALNRLEADELKEDAEGFAEKWVDE